MKTIIKKFITFVFLLCLWSPFSAYSDHYLTSSEEEDLLIEINNMCWDLWCEGGYRFNFHTFICSFDEGECLFGFDYISWRQTEGLFEAECTIYVNSIDDLFANEHNFRMSQYLYNQVSSCIDENSSEARAYFISLEE